MQAWKQIPFLIVLIVGVGVGAARKLPGNLSVPAVVIFGDSIVDTGNNNFYTTIAKCNFPPYGQDFMGGNPTGRFSNGKVPSDLLVEELGIKPLLPPYLDPSLSDEDLLTGVNFAAGAAGWDPITANLSAVKSLADQLEMFKGYIEKVKKIGGEQTLSKLLNESMVAVVTGSNDISNTYFITPFRRLHYDVPSYVELLVSYASSFVLDLYGLGVRRIGVTSLPPVGCLPSQRTLRGGLERKCVDEYNEVAELFNHKLSAQLLSINAQLDDAYIFFIDIYTLPLDFIQNPLKYGFKIGDRGCCGSGTIEVTFLCKDVETCENVNDYVFWDSFHPTEKAYRILINEIIDQFLENICSTTELC
ncbi:GDSL esterase/lipase EXL3-like [Salvia miltiorrhiza]|uniref:GDSL esterase/lipase EXL3-like n=1 Tax=Salvia miltiorrhiza TaxID=226208 RepID=UPI0025AC200E|nr:GDSL esterase/lipase EXL3-like [Salvia miltiorrhiza]